MKVSNCCGERGDFREWGRLKVTPTYEQQDLCPKCGEHCEYIEEGDLTKDEPEEQKCYHPTQSRVLTHRGYHCGDCGKQF